MIEHIFYRTDFTKQQDGSGDDFFDTLLYALGIPEIDWDKYDTATVYIDAEKTELN